MGFYLHVEVDTTLPPEQFRDEVLAPLREALEREGLGRLIDDEDQPDAAAEGRYDLGLEVTDQERARAVVAQVLRSAGVG